MTKSSKPDFNRPQCPKCQSEVDTTVVQDADGGLSIIASCRGCQSVGAAPAEGISPDMLDARNPSPELVQRWLLAQRMAVENIAA